MTEKHSSFAQHLKQLQACRRCPDVHPPPVVGAVAGAAIMLIGQAPGPREMESGRPFVFTAGRTLFKWIASIGVEEEVFRQRVHMGAVIRCFPGKFPGGQGDRKPSRSEVDNCREHYLAELRLLRPGLLLLVGKLAIEQFIPHRRLDEVVGRSFPLHSMHSLHPLQIEGHPLTAFPLPHPSGLSRWIQAEAGKALLAEALQAIAVHPVWREVFPESAR